MFEIMNEIYKTTNQNNTVTRNSSLKSFKPLRTKVLSQKFLLHLGSFILNSQPDNAKLSNNGNTFKHKVKQGFLRISKEKYQNIYVFYR